MGWDAIANSIRSLEDTLTHVIRTCELDPASTVRVEQSVQRALLEFQRSVWEHVADRTRPQHPYTDPTTHRLAYMYTIGYFGTLSAVWYVGIPDGVHDMLVTLLGVLTAAQMAIVGYYFGSSHGSLKKSEVLERVVNHKP